MMGNVRHCHFSSIIPLCHLNSGIVCNNAEFAPRREKSMRGASTAPAGRDTVAHPRVKESPVTPGAVKAKESPSLREKAR